MKKMLIGLVILWVICVVNFTVKVVIPFFHGDFATQTQTVSAEPPKPKEIPLPSATDIEAGINQYRVDQGLQALNSDVPALDEAAAIRADQMCKDNDWSHARDWQILMPYYNYAYAGENLYYGFKQDDQANVAVKAWIASPTHQHNMVDNYNEMGVAVKYCPGFQNEPHAVIVTNYFGVPR